MSEIIDKIRARLKACPIPEGAKADWKDTRHFEIQTPREKDFWWLEPEAWQLAMLPHVEGSDECQERCGAVLDYAVAYRGDVQALLVEIDQKVEPLRKEALDALQSRAIAVAQLRQAEYDRDAATDRAYRECAERMCSYCAVHTRAGFTFQDVGDGILQHVSREGTAHECKAVRLRFSRPQAFEKP